MFDIKEISSRLAKYSRTCSAEEAVGAAPVFVIPERSFSVVRQAVSTRIMPDLRTVPVKLVPSLTDGVNVITAGGERFNSFHDLMRSLSIMFHARAMTILAEIPGELLSSSRSADLSRFISEAENYRGSILLLLSVDREDVEALSDLLDGLVSYSVLPSKETSPRDCAELCMNELSVRGLDRISGDMTAELEDIFSGKNCADISFAETAARELVWAAGSSGEEAVRLVIEKIRRSAEKRKDTGRIGF